MPEPLETERLRLRSPQPGDRPGLVELESSDEVRRYLGGPRPRHEVEASYPQDPQPGPGFFAVEADGKFVGFVILDRREPDKPGHIRPEGNELEISYQFLPADWGRGYATEAVRAVIDWTATTFPAEPIVLCTQVANERSMRLAQRVGFVEHERFEQFGAEQWFGVFNETVRLPGAGTH